MVLWGMFSMERQTLASPTLTSPSKGYYNDHSIKPETRYLKRNSPDTLLLTTPVQSSPMKVNETMESFWNWSLAFEAFKSKCIIICVILKGIIMSRKPRPASPILNIVNVFTAKSWVGLLLYNIHICFNDCSHHYHYHHTLPRPGDSVVTIFIIISLMFPFCQWS